MFHRCLLWKKSTLRKESVYGDTPPETGGRLINILNNIVFYYRILTKWTIRHALFLPHFKGVKE